MPRTKKTEVVDVEKVLEQTMKDQDLGTGMTRINNEIEARRNEKNE